MGRADQDERWGRAMGAFVSKDYDKSIPCVYADDRLCYSPPNAERRMGLEPNYIIIDGQNFSKAKLALDNHVYKNCQIDDCDLYYSGGQYELLDTHITNSRLILNHPAKGIYNALQIFKMKSPGSRIVFE
jgi:hypothetical protein